MPPRCVVIGCSNSGYHFFPKDLGLQKLWENAVKIKATRNSKICSSHFKDTDFQRIIYVTGSPRHRYLNKRAVPSIFPWNKPSSAVSIREEQYLRCRSRQELLYPSTSQQVPADDATSMETINEIYIPGTPDFEPKIEITFDEEDAVPHSGSTTVSTQTPYMFRLFSSHDLLSDDNSVLFYTGLENFKMFNLVLSTLLPMANHLKFKGSQNLSTEDQFLLMLIKLRRNKADFELSKMFGISAEEVGNIFTAWIKFAYKLWSMVDMWPSPEILDDYMPKSFKLYHPSPRVIVAHQNINNKTPTSVNGLTQLSGVKLQDHAHILRLIGMTKIFKILKTEINGYYIPILSKIFFVCVRLCKFKEQIVK